MKIAYLLHGLGYGGATKSLILLHNRIVKDHQTFIYSLPFQKHKEIANHFINTSIVKQIKIPTIHSHPVSTIPLRLFRKNKNYFPSELIQEINKNGIDILHINSTLFSHLLKPVKENTAAKIVVHLREALPYGINNVVDKFIIDNIIAYADAIIAISDNEIKFYPANDKITVLPNPHDFNETDKYLEIKSNDKLVIGMCAGFLDYKGHFDFIDAAKIIMQSNEIINNNIEFKIIGYPLPSKRFKDKIKSFLNYGYKSKFDNKLKNSQLSNISIVPNTFNIYEELAQFDIYVRPDVTAQPWGRDIIEAMAIKKAIVATGKSEFYIRNGTNGFLVDQNQPIALADKILILIKDPGLRYEFGERSYNKIKLMCDLEEYKNIFDDIYLRLQRVSF